MKINNLVSSELVEIPHTKRGGSKLVQRYMYYTPRFDKWHQRSGISAEELIASEQEKVGDLYPRYSNQDRFVWLSEKSTSGKCYKIDLALLNTRELRQPMWADGDVVYRGDIMPGAIVGVHAPDIISESKENIHYDEIADMIKRDCQEYLTMWNGETPLFMGFRDIKDGVLFPDTGRFLYKPFEQTNLSNQRDQNVTGKYFISFMDNHMQESGFEASRQNSMIASGSIDTASLDGGVHAVFPVDGFDFSWSDEVADYVKHFANSEQYHSTKYPKSHLGIDLRIREYWESIKGSYHTEDINAAIASKKEILIKATGFYAIQYQTYIDMVKNGHLVTK